MFLAHLAKGNVNFCHLWPSGFRGEDFLKIGQSETRIACANHIW
jgi:hypothetical protein